MTGRGHSDVAKAGFSLLATTLAALAGFALGWVSFLLVTLNTELGPFDSYTSWWWVFLVWPMLSSAILVAASVVVGRKSRLLVLTAGSPFFGLLTGFIVFWSVFLLVIWEPLD